MQELEKRLKRQLLQNEHIQLKHCSSWCIPIHTVEVEYQPIRRVNMDVLMKMLLLSFQQMEIEDACELSELLVVEQLFIEDLIAKLLKTGVIDYEDGIYKLTTKGERQLKDGIFEEQLPLEKQVVLYSATHEQFYSNQLDDDVLEELPALYRYAKEELSLQTELAKDDIKTVILAVRESAEVDDEQIVIADILSISSMQINDITCLEFVLYDSETDSLYVRVWNTLLSKWDDILEKQLMEREIVTWREQYLD